MPAKETYAMQFTFLNPVKLAVSGRYNEAVDRVVTGLVRGSSLDLDRLDATGQRALLGNSIIELAHRVKDRQRLAQQATEAGLILATYCSLCGRKFQPNKCELCGISFKLRPESHPVTGAFPPAPRLVFTYLKEHGHHFKRRLPRA